MPRAKAHPRTTHAARETFNPAAYLDLMIATGQEPFVLRDADGVCSYWERKRIPDGQRERLFLAWEQLDTIPGALDLVKAECLRRNLIKH